MNVVPIKARVIMAFGGAGPAAYTCALCNAQRVPCIALGDEGIPACVRCMRASLVEIAEVTGVPLRVYTEIEGTEQTTAVHIDPNSERDE